MEFIVPCDVIARFAPLARSQKASETRDYLSTIYIERTNNKTFVVATNVKTAAIEYLKDAPKGEDGYILLQLHEPLIKACDNEAAYNSRLHIVYIPEIKFATAKTDFGYVCTDNISHPLAPITTQKFDDVRREWVTWRQWAPLYIPKQTYGALDMSAIELYGLARASPSGRLLFPLHIDRRMSVLVRDSESDDWCGLFMPDTGTENKGVELPVWMK